MKEVKVQIFPPPPPSSPHPQHANSSEGLTWGTCSCPARAAPGWCCCSAGPACPARSASADWPGRGRTPGCHWWTGSPASSAHTPGLESLWTWKEFDRRKYWFRPVTPLGVTASLAKWLRHPPRERKIPGSNPASAGFFRGQVIPVTQKIGTPVATLPDVIGSALGLVGLASVTGWDGKFGLQLLSRCGST